MIARLVQPVLEQALTAQAAVAIIGPRQVGKTTLAREIADSRPGSLYLDLEAREDREKLTEPVLFLKQYERALSRERSVIPKGFIRAKFITGSRDFRRSPDQLGPDHVREYQIHQFRDRKLSHCSTICSFARVPRRCSKSHATRSTWELISPAQCAAHMWGQIAGENLSAALPKRLELKRL